MPLRLLFMGRVALDVVRKAQRGYQTRNPVGVSRSNCGHLQEVAIGRILPRRRAAACGRVLPSWNICGKLLHELVRIVQAIQHQRRRARENQFYGLEF